MLGTQPSFTHTSHSGNLYTCKLESFPDVERESIPSNLRLAKIECCADDSYIWNLKITMSDSTESLFSRQDRKPNVSFSLPSNIKIAKLRGGFEKSQDYPGLFSLTQFELYDSNGGLIWTFGDNKLID